MTTSKVFTITYTAQVGFEAPLGSQPLQGSLTSFLEVIHIESPL